MKTIWGNKRFQGFWMGVLCCCLVLSLWGGVYAANRNLSVSDGIKVILNGQAFQPKDAKGNPVELFNYNGTVYAPVRALCEQAGMEVSYDSATKTVTVATTPVSGTAVTQQQAQEIALAKAPGATVVKCKRDWEDGVEVFEIELRKGFTEYECEIEIATGKILKWEEENH